MLSKCLIGLSLLLLVVGCSAQQGDFQRMAVYGGYSYLNVDTNGLTSRQSMNGWESGFSYNATSWLAAEANVSGYYKGASALGVSARASDYAYVFGPRFNYHVVYAHALFGVDHLGGSVSGGSLSGSASQNGFAMAVGGGVQVPVARHVAVRGGMDYVMSRHNAFGGNAYTQNNFRAGAGVAFTF